MFNFFRRLFKRKPGTLLCMRSDETFNKHPEQISSVCSRCGHSVSIWPSGQSALRVYPNLAIICTHCASPDEYQEPAPGAIEEAAQYLRRRRRHF